MNEKEKNEINETSLTLVEKFDGLKNHELFSSFYKNITRSGLMTEKDITPLYNHMVNISNRNQEGAIVTNERIRKIWNTVERLSRRNLSLVSENEVLKAKLTELEDKIDSVAELVCKKT